MQFVSLICLPNTLIIIIYIKFSGIDTAMLNSNFIFDNLRSLIQYYK